MLPTTLPWYPLLTVPEVGCLSEGLAQSQHTSAMGTECQQAKVHREECGCPPDPFCFTSRKERGSVMLGVLEEKGVYGTAVRLCNL